MPPPFEITVANSGGMPPGSLISVSGGGPPQNYIVTGSRPGSIMVSGYSSLEAKIAASLLDQEKPYSKQIPFPWQRTGQHASNSQWIQMGRRAGKTISFGMMYGMMYGMYNHHYDMNHLRELLDMNSEVTHMMKLVDGLGVPPPLEPVRKTSWQRLLEPALGDDDAV